MALEDGDLPEAGTHVTGDESESLGKVHRVFTDDDGRAAWVQVELSHTHGEVRAVPMAQAMRNTSHGIAVPYSKAQLLSSPDLGGTAAGGDAPEELDDDTRRRLAGWFRLPVAESGGPVPVPAPAPAGPGPGFPAGGLQPAPRPPDPEPPSPGPHHVVTDEPPPAPGSPASSHRDPARAGSAGGSGAARSAGASDAAAPSAPTATATAGGGASAHRAGPSLVTGSSGVAVAVVAGVLVGGGTAWALTRERNR